MAAGRCGARWAAALWSIGATLGLGPTAARAAPGCDAIVYFDADFGGESREVFGDERFVGPHWNDQISSIRIRAGDWIFYRDAGYRGDVLRFGPGSYPTLPPSWNDQISSFQCVEGPGDVGADTYVYEGETYGWYDGGWNGPGFYVVGLQTVRGRGFGGRDGVHGWRHHERRDRRDDHGHDHHDDGGRGRDGRDGGRPGGPRPFGPPGHPLQPGGFHPPPPHPRGDHPSGWPRPGGGHPSGRPHPGGGHPSGRPHPGGGHPSPHRGGGGRPPPHRHR